MTSEAWRVVVLIVVALIVWAWWAVGWRRRRWERHVTAALTAAEPTGGPQPCPDRGKAHPALLTVGIDPALPDGTVSLILPDGVSRLDVSWRQSQRIAVGILAASASAAMVAGVSDDTFDAEVIQARHDLLGEGR